MARSEEWEVESVAEIIKYNHVYISYDQKPVIYDADFSVEEGEILGIVGESGSGKTSLLKAAMGLLGRDGQVTQGEILYQERNLLNLPEKELRKICGEKIGMIFQSAGASFCPIRTIRSQLQEFVLTHKQMEKKDIDNEASELLVQVGFEDPNRIMDSYPFELSGGMQQRVGIVAAMLLQPRILMADEPTAALDVAVQKQVVEHLLKIRENYGTSILMVTHNIGLVEKMADRVLVLHQGKMMEYGEKEQVLKNPVSAYTRELLAAVPRIRR